MDDIWIIEIIRSILSFWYNELQRFFKVISEPLYWNIISILAIILAIIRWGKIKDWFNDIANITIVDPLFSESDVQDEPEPQKKPKKPLNQIQKICILIVIACFWLWVGFGDGFRPQYSVIAFAIGITSIVAFFLFKDK